MIYDSTAGIYYDAMTAHDHKLSSYHAARGGSSHQGKLSKAIRFLKWHATEAFDRVYFLRRPRYYRILGMKLYLDDLDSLDLAIHRIHEPEETHILESLVKEGMSVVDIGANIGYYSVLFSRWAGPTGHVYAFEPDPDNFRVLERNISLNQSRNITAERMAVSDSNEPIKLFISEESRGDHRSFESDESRASVEVPATTLDSYLKGKRVDLIKMDIQGAEAIALEGMRETLQKNPGLVIVTEYWPYGIQSSGHDPVKLAERLAETFDFYVIRPGVYQQERLSLDDIRSLPEHKDHYLDLILTPKASARADSAG